MDSSITLMGYRAGTDGEKSLERSNFRSSKCSAVFVKNAYYHHLRSKRNILDGLCMNVPQGFIYGLTGSSGCGKTTLISCILGTRTVDKGEIFLYGYDHKSPDRQKLIDIPGKGVGFMPQELSLYSKFTIREILLYFGRLYGMPTQTILHSANKLLKLLSLSPPSSRIEVLSKGEKRRVSFAVSLIHSPKLLVLDEPTVGLDPLLRYRIWEHLRSLIKEREVTVIITSHYLEEMRKADIIGFMRGGQIIAEDTPHALLSLSNADSLDDAVLNLCKNIDFLPVSKRIKNSDIQAECQASDHTHVQQINKAQLLQLRESFLRIRAVIRKNIYTLLCNIPLLLFVMCLPASQLLIVLLFGYEPSHMELGVFNGELASSTYGFPENHSSFVAQACPDFPENELNTCDLNLLSCRFLSHISATKVTLKHFNTTKDAISAIEGGAIYGFIGFGEKFSTSLVDRMLIQTDNGTLKTDVFTESQITARFDQSNTIIYRLLLNELYQSQEAFLTSLLSSCGVNRKLGEYPLQYHAPIFGVTDDFSFSNFVAPGATIPFMFFFSIISSGLRIVEERNCGTFDRMLIAGVKHSEMMLSFLVSEFVIVTAQSSVIFGFLLWWLPMQSFQSLGALFAFLLMMLAGYTGISLGVLLGSFCTEQFQVAIIAVAFILPNINLSGILWPLEGMSMVIQTIVQFLPCTLSSKAVSSIWLRGLGVTHPNVWPGIVVLMVYILILNILTVISHNKVKK